MRHLTTRVGLLVALGCVGLTIPTQADACSVKEGQHCYAVEQWSMLGSPAEVIGAYAHEIIAYGKTPNWISPPSGEGGFQDDEMWVVFPNFSEDAWVEAGATIGWPYSETVPLYFVARSYNAKNYWEYVWPSWGPGYNNWFGYYIDEPHGQNGEWCVTWEWESKPIECFTSFPKSSKDLQAGLEFATTTASGADNNGLILGWQQWTNGAWYENWESAWNKPSYEDNKPLCINEPAPGHNYGSVAFAVPGC
jgi:hypothetical protein